MDMKVFVDADSDVRLSRRSANFYFVLFFFSHKLLELDTIHDTLVP